MMKQENKIHLLKFHGKTCFPACFLFGNYFVIFCVRSWVSVKSWYCRKPRLSYWIVKANQNKIISNFLVELPSLYIMSESDPGNFADSFWSSFSPSGNLFITLALARKTSGGIDSEARFRLVEINSCSFYSTRCPYTWLENPARQHC